MSIQLYEVTVGSDVFKIMAKDNQEARYEAAKLFKEKYSRKSSSADIAMYASTKLVRDTELTTKQLLKKLD